MVDVVTLIMTIASFGFSILFFLAPFFLSSRPGSLMSLAATAIVVVVGSRNPTKVAAVEAVVRDMRMFAGSQVLVEGVEVESLVSAQPMSRKETIEGATNRAKAVLRMRPDCKFAIGLEAGLDTERISQSDDDLFFLSTWAVILDRDQVPFSIDLSHLLFIAPCPSHCNRRDLTRRR